MNDVNTLIEVDWQQVIIALVVGLGVIVGFWKSAEYIATKLGIETRQSRDRKLLEQTAKNLSELQKQHVSDVRVFKETQQTNVEQSIKHDERIRNELKEFTTEVRSAIDELNAQMQQYNDNRVHDRAQSFSIQRELTDSIKAVADGGDRREQQIDALMVGNRELLGAEIDRRFDKYIELQGIPADEYDEFVSLHDAYKGCKGNHNRDAKYDYIIENLSVLPVESKLKK